MTTKKFFTKEVKIGISFVVAFALLYWGINFLKGVNLFTPTNHFSLKFEQIDGLVVSNGVFIQGYKVGQVHEIKYNFDNTKPFTVIININDDIKLPQGTTATLTDESLMGGKCINLIFSQSQNYHIAGDTLTTTIDRGLFGAIADIVPTLTATVQHADSLLTSLNQIVNSPEIKSSLSNINSITTNLNKTSRSLNTLMDNKMPKIINQLDTTLSNLNSISTKLNRIDFNDIMLSVDSTLTNINEFTQRINDPNGTIGLLMNDPSLYREVTNTVTSANNLLIDLKANPKRYVHFSLFGRKDKEKRIKSRTHKE